MPLSKRACARQGRLLIVVPRHPDRGDAIVDLMRGRGITTRQWSKDRSPPGAGVDVLVADTMGELLFWYAAADAVYLGGATAEDIGGHNPVEPAQLGKRVFTGPHGFNFRETFETLERAGALTVGRPRTRSWRTGGSASSRRRTHPRSRLVLPRLAGAVRAEH